MVKYGAIALISVVALSASAQAGGPHFLAEGGVGVIRGLSDADDIETGRAASVMVGVGGRPAGSWLRYYFLVELLTGSYGRSLEQSLRTITLDRSLLEVALAGRVVAPFTPHFRVFLDGGAAAIRTSTDFFGTHLATESSAELDWGLRLATGFQYRPIELLSVGLRLSVTTALDDFDSEVGPGWLADFESESGHYEGMLQVSFYF